LTELNPDKPNFMTQSDRD